jgi:hypothetical protein
MLAYPLLQEDAQWRYDNGQDDADQIHSVAFPSS